MTDVSKTATFIKSIAGWRADARAFRLDPPLTGARYDGDDSPVEIVIVSAVEMAGEPETYLFPATEESLLRNDAASMLEMNGSQKGTLDHAQVLADLGYTVVTAPSAKV